MANSVANAAVEAIGMDESAISHRLPPAEIDFLHRADICLSLPIQELWPELFTGDTFIVGIETKIEQKI